MKLSHFPTGVRHILALGLITTLGTSISGCSKKNESANVSSIKTTTNTTTETPLEKPQETPPETTQSQAVSFQETQLGDHLLVTNEEQITLQGSCESGSTIDVVSGSKLESTSCTPENRWTYLLTPSDESGSTEGLHPVTLIQRSSTGQRKELTRTIRIDKTQPELGDLVAGAKVRVRRGNKVTLKVNKIDPYENQELEYGISDLADCSDLKDDAFKSITLNTNNQIVIQIGDIQEGQTLLTKYISLRDDAKNRSTCKKIEVTLDDTVSGQTVALGFAESNGTFTPADVFNLGKLNDLKMKLTSNEAGFFQVFSNKDSCAKSTSGSLKTAFIDSEITTGKVIAYPTGLTATSPSQDLKVFLKFKDKVGNVSSCIESSSVLFDVDKPKLGTTPPAVKKIPYGLKAFPKITLTAVPGITEAKNYIHHYKVDLFKSGDSASQCTGNLPSKSDGSMANPRSPSFDSTCTLVANTKYFYSLKAVDQAGNESESGVKSSEWTSQLCAASSAGTANFEKDSFIAINEVDIPFCIARYETRKATGDTPKVNTTDPVWTGISFDDAKTKCEALDPGKTKLINNAQWMSVARSISRDYRNWYSSSGSPMPKDQLTNPKDYSLAYGLDSQSAVDQNSTTYKSSGLNSRKLYAVNSLIYDFSSNAAEWVDTDPEVIKRAQSISNATVETIASYFQKNPWASLLDKLPTTPTELVQAAGDYRLDKNPRDCASQDLKCGFGKLEFSLIKDPKITDLSPYALIRGGMAVTKAVDRKNLGIFAAGFKKKTDPDPFIGFRCIYQTNQ